MTVTVAYSPTTGRPPGSATPALPGLSRSVESGWDLAHRWDHAPSWDHLRAGTDIAHRGGALLAPENTMAAFERAADLGVPLDADVQLLADGTPVLFHDDTLDRTTDGRGPVAALTAPQYDRLLVDAGPGSPTEPAGLDDLLTRFDGELLMLEAKSPGSIGPLLDALEAHHIAPATVLVTSFDPRDVLIAGARGWRTGLIGTVDVAQATAAGADWLLPSQAGVTTQVVTAAHAAGLRVAPWTVNDLPARAAMIATGADALITDTPAAAPS
jgi:glycerophosphoryl diester phosphodiesterase